MGQHRKLLEDQPITVIEDNRYLVDWVKTGIETLGDELKDNIKLRMAYARCLIHQAENYYKERFEWVPCLLFETGEDGRGVPDDDVIMFQVDRDHAIDKVNELLRLGYFSQAEYLTVYTAEVSGDFLYCCMFNENNNQFYGVDKIPGFYIFFNTTCKSWYERTLVDVTRNLKTVHTWNLKSQTT